MQRQHTESNDTGGELIGVLAENYENHEAKDTKMIVLDAMEICRVYFGRMQRLKAFPQIILL